MKNRFMLAPLTNQQSHDDGTLSDAETRWLTMRATGGFGMTMTAAAYVQQSGRAFPGQLGIADDSHLPGLTAMADQIRAAQGPAALLANLDPATAARIDRQNPARIQRAWEVLRATGRGLADWQDDTGPPLLPLHQAQALVLTPDPPWLNARIDRRFDAMMAAGALDEVRAELPFWEPSRPSARAIGAPELIAHLKGELPLSDAIAAAKIASHQYAKRQRTWFRSRMRSWQRIALP